MRQIKRAITPAMTAQGHKRLCQPARRHGEVTPGSGQETIEKGRPEGRP